MLEMFSLLLCVISKGFMNDGETPDSSCSIKLLVEV